MSHSHYDIVIIGGGLVGASLACALNPLGLKIALVESVEFQAASQPSYDDRTLALSASSCAILESLGLWAGLQDNATALREIHVRELNRPGHVVMKPQELGLEQFGYVVEARVFGAAIMAQVPSLEQVEFICPATVESLQLSGAGCSLTVATGDGPRQLSATLVVGADGAGSFVRQAAGIEADTHDYGQTAVICNITPQEAHDGRAFEYFTPTGPLAVMPHVEGRCGLIWCVGSGEAQGLLDQPEDEFLERAQRRFGWHLGAFQRIGRRSAYPLRLVRAKQDVAEHCVILGNAAHAIHPIGAQGFNLGLRDAAALAEVVAGQLRRQGADALGDAAMLARYSEWRRSDQQGTISYSDGLARIFSNPSHIAASFRTLGLMAHAWLPPLRRRMAIKSMGYRGRSPRLALGEPL